MSCLDGWLIQAVKLEPYEEAKQKKKKKNEGMMQGQKEVIEEGEEKRGWRWWSMDEEEMHWREKAEEIEVENRMVEIN